MHAVRGIADERKLIGDQRAGEMHVERPGGARTGELDGAQPVAEALLDFGQKDTVVERQDLPRVRFLLGPGDARAVADQRQHGERSGRQEMLHGPSVVRLLVANDGDDADLGIAPAHYSDAGRLAQLRGAAVGGDQQWGAQ